MVDAIDVKCCFACFSDFELLLAAARLLVRRLTKVDAINFAHSSVVNATDAMDCISLSVDF